MFSTRGTVVDVYLIHITQMCTKSSITKSKLKVQQLYIMIMALFKGMFRLLAVQNFMFKRNSSAVPKV